MPGRYRLQMLGAAASAAMVVAGDRIAMTPEGPHLAPGLAEAVADRLQQLEETLRTQLED